MPSKFTLIYKDSLSKRSIETIKALVKKLPPMVEFITFKIILID